MSLTRILVISPLWPHPGHVEAANVIMFELMREMAGRDRLRIGFLKLGRGAPAAASDHEQAGIAALRELGVDFLEPLHLPATPAAPLRTQLLKGRAVDFFPEISHRAEANRVAEAFAPDLLFIPWSEWATNLFSDYPGRKFAYYGNPEPKAMKARADFEFRIGRRWPRYLASLIYWWRMQARHLEIMRRYEILADVAANDADYYRDHGHPNAFYVQNLWIDRFGDSWRPRRAQSGERLAPAVIVANVGRVSATANTFGLEILGRDLVPELRRRLPAGGFELHVLGGGEPHPAIRPWLAAPEIRLRGFVDDIDGELLSSPIFLCLNNGSRFNVGHTRYLHAWSLGCCVIAHRDAALAMPEIRHGENALLGDSPAAIAELITEALANPALRRQIGEGGYRSFRDSFLAGSVVDRIVAAIEAPGR
ncbi:MAG: glycosyltransferase [Azospirillum sp.]|nr:glycosyltransferase [Azospirillum sp.]